MDIISIGALVFGVVVGFLTYRTLVRTADKAAVSDLAAIIGAIGGGAVTKLYDPSGSSFAWYAIGLAVGIAIFFIAFLLMNGREVLAAVMSGDTQVIGNARRGSGNGPKA